MTAAPGKYDIQRRTTTLDVFKFLLIVCFLLVLTCRTTTLDVFKLYQNYVIIKQLESNYNIGCI